VLLATSISVDQEIMYGEEKSTDGREARA